VVGHVERVASTPLASLLHVFLLPQPTTLAPIPIICQIDLYSPRRAQRGTKKEIRWAIEPGDWLCHRNASGTWARGTKINVNVTKLKTRIKRFVLHPFALFVSFVVRPAFDV
jgi:hypothetical protein